MPLASRRRVLGLAGGALALPVAVRPAAARSPVPSAPVDVTVRSFPINAFLPREPDKTEFGASPTAAGWSCNPIIGASAASPRCAGRGRTAAHRHFRPGPVADRDARHGRRPPLRPLTGAHGGHPRPRRATARRDRQLGFGGSLDRGRHGLCQRRAHPPHLPVRDLRPRGGAGPCVPQPVPMGSERLAGNRGIEALGILPRPSPLAGTLCAISERGLNAAGDIPPSSSARGPRASSTSSAPMISTSPTSPSCPAATCCCWSAGSRPGGALPSAFAASTSPPSAPGRRWMGRSCSRATWRPRSTTWRDRHPPRPRGRDHRHALLGQQLLVPAKDAAAAVRLSRLTRGDPPSLTPDSQKRRRALAWRPESVYRPASHDFDYCPGASSCGPPEESSMAVPRRKTSPSRRGMRRSHDAIAAPTYVEDKDSGNLRRPHHVDLKTACIAASRS